MVEIALAGAPVLVSLAVCLLLIRMLGDRPVETRGMAGLAATVLHMALSLVLPAIVWVAARPDRPVVFALGVLAFYLISLIILVVAIIRWLQASSLRATGGSPGPGESPDGPELERNSRSEKQL